MSVAIDRSAIPFGVGSPTSNVPRAPTTQSFSAGARSSSTRSVRDLGKLVEDYFASRFTLLSVSDSIDTRSAAGRLVLHVLGAVSQWEREATGERTREAVAHIKSEGARLGGAALGWGRSNERDAEGRLTVVELEEERDTVERIVALRREGRTLTDIATTLEREGRLTKRGGQRWYPVTVSRVVRRAAASRANDTSKPRWDPSCIAADNTAQMLDLDGERSLASLSRRHEDEK